MSAGLLSQQELRCVGLLSLGRKSADVAGILAISKRTVDFHLANAYKTLGVTNRIQAVDALRDSGMLDAALSLAQEPKRHKPRNRPNKTPTPTVTVGYAKQKPFSGDYRDLLSPETRKRLESAQQ